MYITLGVNLQPWICCRWVKKNNQEKLINMNDDWFFDSRPVEVNRWYKSCFVGSQQIFIHSLRLFLHGTSLLLPNLVSHVVSEATTFVIGREYSNTPTIPCNKWYAYSLTQEFSFPMVWNLHEYCMLMLKSARLRPPLWKIFDRCGDVLISTSAPSHWLNSVAWPDDPVLKFSCSLY